MNTNKVNNMSDTKKEFNEWFSGLGLKYFKAHEFTNYFERNLNKFPPKSKWDNIIPTIKLIDKLRGDLGVPVRITSSYRSSAYNKNCGGASKSLHKEFKAIDLQVSGFKPSYVYSKLRKYRDEGLFKGGLSEYSTFVHIDTRGKNADW